MSRPLNVLEIEAKISYLNQTRQDLLKNNCYDAALALGALIHAYLSILGEDMDDLNNVEKILKNT